MKDIDIVLCMLHQYPDIIHDTLSSYRTLRMCYSDKRSSFSDLHFIHDSRRENP